MKNETVESFVQTGSAEESNWRSIVLFGRNVASYKFALAKSLMGLAKDGKDSVLLDELAVPFAHHLCEHIAHSPKQSTSRSSKFLDACKGYNDGAITEDQLISTTVQLGFNNVLDAFHVVGQDSVPIEFFKKDFSRSQKRLILTDSVFNLAASEEARNILQETESRWNLVETAWEMGINANLLAYDEQSQQIIVDNALRRKDVTSARGALNGYQKGRCFYCYTGISAEEENDNTPTLVLSNEPSRFEYAFITLDDSDDYDEDAGVANDADTGVTNDADADLCDVDHFFPHVLNRMIRNVNFDGVWNLVLACKDCNRGPGGKFTRIPELRYLERLYRRNEYLILSHHPLRDTLISQTGSFPEDRWIFLKSIDARATELLPGARWSIEQRAEAIF